MKLSDMATKVENINQLSREMGIGPVVELFLMKGRALITASTGLDTFNFTADLYEFDKDMEMKPAAEGGYVLGDMYAKYRKVIR